MTYHWARATTARNRFAMRAVSVFAIVVSLMLTSCSKQGRPVIAANQGTVIVSAAASTKDAIESLAEAFRQTGDVKVNSGPSNGLATQIIAGAPTDLFLSANEQWAKEVQKAGLAVGSTRLLTNSLVLVVPAGNPAHIHEPKDLLSANVRKIALAGEDAPAGKYGDQALASLKLLDTLISEKKIVRGQDVRTALAYVERGEAEAGIVYSTDVRVAKGVESVFEFDPRSHDEIVYVLVLLKHGDGNATVRDFESYLKSPEADKVYSKFGFTRVQTM